MWGFRCSANCTDRSEIIVICGKREGEAEGGRDGSRGRSGTYIFFIAQSEAIFNLLSRAARTAGGSRRSVSIISGYSSMYKSSAIKPGDYVSGLKEERGVVFRVVRECCVSESCLWVCVLLVGIVFIMWYMLDIECQ